MALAQPEQNQAMRGMIFRSDRYPTSIPAAGDTHQRRVKYRQKKNQGWNRQGQEHAGEAAGRQHRAAAQKESHSQAARISHKNFSGMEIEDEKAQQGARHRQRQETRRGVRSGKEN